MGNKTFCLAYLAAWIAIIWLAMLTHQFTQAITAPTVKQSLMVERSKT